MNRKLYMDMNEKIHPSEVLLQRVLSGTGKRAAKPPVRRKLIPATVAAALAIALAAPATLAASPAYQWLYELSPQVAQFFAPVRESCEDNGILMEVLAARTEGNSTNLYIALRDLTGNRIDETIDLFDSYHINTPFDSSGTCTLAEYDSETQTAVFLISLTENSNRDLAGKKVTFSVQSLLSQKRSESDTYLGAIPEPFSKGTMALSFDAPPHSDYTLFSVSEHPVENRSVTILTPAEDGLDLPGSYDYRITGTGWIDGRLHIQIATSHRLTHDAQAQLRLRDQGGTIIEPVGKYAFAQNSGREGRMDYEEYIYDLPQGDLTGYSLYGDFSIAGLRTDGNWQVTFRMPESPQDGH
ncbi:MAG: hypothetical protein ACLU8W_12320 [Clostridia bacterium]